MAGINFVRRWVMSQMTKKADDGIMITLPDSSKVDLNVNITMDRLLRNGINPDAFTNPQQVDNAINMINSRMVERAIPANSAEGREITEKLFGKQKAPVFDLEGNRIPEGSGIMGGKAVKELMDSGQVTKGARGMKKSKKVEDREMFQKSNLNKTEAQLKAEMEASNKKGIANIKNKRQLTEDEYQDFLDEVGGADQLEAYNFDGTVGDAKRIIKEQKDYMSQMEMEFRKGNLDPEPGSGTSQRKRFLQKKLEEAESSGDARLMSREEREELFDLDDIPEYATGGRAGYKSGNSVLDQALAVASVPYNFGKGIIGNVSNPGAVTDVSLTGAQTNFLDSIAKSKGPSGTIDYSDYGGPTKTFSGVSGMNPMQASLATTMGGTDYSTNPDGSIDYTGGAYDFNKGNVVTDFIDKGGILGAVDRLGDGAIGKLGESIYGAVNPEEDPYADIKGQTAGLGVASFLAEKFGPKIGAAIFNYGKNKILNKGKEFVIDKPIQKILKTSGGSKKIKTGGGGGGSSQANVGGGNTAKNSKGQTASQATKAGTGTSQGYSQHYADGGITRANFVGGGMGRRGFLKMLAGAGAGIAGLKSGLVNILGKGGTKEVAKEVVQKSTTGSPPPYFFKLAEKIKMMGDDATATTDRTIAKTLKSKDGKSTYVLEEDVSTGDTIIKKINKEGDEMITDVEIMELKKGEVVMGKDGKPVKVPDEYEEVTEANARIEGDTFNDPYYSDGIKIDEIMKEVGEQAPSIKKASGGIARFGYQVGGDVSYDATDPIYGSSAATFTPNTVMDQFGNQVQSELGNNFNKPLIPQVTDQAATNRRYTPPTEKESLTAGPVFPAGTGGLTDIPAAGGMGGLGETDMPIAGGINNQIGILPVMPPLEGGPSDSNMKIGKFPVGGGEVVGNYSDPLPQDQLMSGFAEWKRNNPDKVSNIGTQAIKYMTLPNGEQIMFPGGAEASNMARYLESIGQPPMTPGNQNFKPIGDPNAELKMALASGGIARMLGE